MKKVKKILLWFIKNLVLFLILYAVDQIIISSLGLHPSVYQAVLLWLCVKIIMIPFKIKNSRR